MKYGLIGFALASVMSCSVMAGDTNIDTWKKIIEKASEGHATITKTAQAPDGLTAVIIDSVKGEPSMGEVLAWGLPSGLLMIGNLYDREGHLVNARFNLAQPDLSDSLATILEQSSKETPLPTSEGQGREFFVFIDPSCGHCKKTWSSLHGRVPEGVKITWLPVNILNPNPDGDARAAYASLGLNEMNQVMTNNLGAEFKAFKPLESSESQSAAVGLGMGVMHLAKRKATPMVIWRDANGNQKIEYTSISPEWLSSRK